MVALRALLVVTLLLTVAPLLTAQQTASEEIFSERTRVVAVDVAIEVAKPDRIEAADLEISDDGAVRPVVSLMRVDDPDAGRWRIVVYFDLPLATSGTVQAAISTLAEQVESLTGLGEVEVVVADPNPRRLMPPTDNPELLNQALSRLLLRLQNTDALNQIRQRALAGTDAASDADQDEPPLDAETAVLREVTLVTHQQDELLVWIASHGLDTGAKALFLVTDGYDLDPGAFYASRMSGPTGGAWAQRFLARNNADLAKSLSGYGWLVYPLTFRHLESDPEGRVADFDRYRYETMDGPYGDRTALVPIDLKGGRKKKKKAAEGFLLLEPLQPLQILAETTGGRLVEKSTAVVSELTALMQRLLVTFQASETLDGRLRSLSIQAGKQATKGPGWVRSGTPQPVAEARIRRVFSGTREAAGLGVEVRWAPRTEGSPGRMVEIEVTAVEPPGPEGVEMPTMRVSLGQRNEAGPITYQHQVVNNRAYSGDKWSFSAPFKPEPNSDWIVILVEDLGDGSWGAEALEPPLG